MHRHVTLSALPAPAAGTPFEGGVFRMKLVLGQDFPASPPKGTPLLAPPLLHVLCYRSQQHSTCMPRPSVLW